MMWCAAPARSCPARCWRFLTGAIAFMPAQWTERMQTIGSYDADASASERLVLWGISSSSRSPAALG